MARSPVLSRRALLRGAAGGAAVLATGGLPAWARPPAAAAGRFRGPDSRPFPGRPVGTPSMPQIEHIVVLMMENHSFDNLLGMLPFQVPARAAVDGFTRRGSRILDANRDLRGRRVLAAHAGSPCQLPRVPSQTWNASHIAWAGGANSGFVRASGDVAMRYWDRGDLPFTYALAEHFPIGERYFASVLAQTYPNRRFLFTGTSSGTVDDLADALRAVPANGTIWDRLDDARIDWGIYYEIDPVKGRLNLPSWLIVPGVSTPARAPRVQAMTAFFADAAAGRLPRFTFLDPQYDTTSEENPQDIQVGERFVARVTHALIDAPTWRHTALLLTYDEHDHTSITAFVERKWNLPAMTYRDANAHPMIDYFDFRAPAFREPPRLTASPALAPGLARCRSAGLNPPLPGIAG